MLRVCKRPGLTHETVGPSANLLYGAGMLGPVVIFYYAGEAPSRFARVFLSGVEVGTIGAYSHSPGNPDRYFSIEFVPFQQGGVYFLHNKYVAYTLTVDGVLKEVPRNLTSLTLSCTKVNNSAVITTASTASLTIYSTVTGAGIPAGAFIESIDSATQFTISTLATASATSNLNFALAGPGDTPYIAPSGTFLVDGIVDLNSSTYLFTRFARVQGSDLDTPYAWNPLNFIFAYANQDQPVAIAKQLSYIIAFKSESTEFFRDAGLSPGSPLERLEGMRIDVGCYAGRTVQSIDGDVLWASYTESGLKSVWMLRALKPQEIATPAVRRILEAMAPKYAISFSVSGHSFYILTDPAAGISLAYDITAGLWSYWNALGSTYFPFCAATHHLGETLLQHESLNRIYTVERTLGTDDAAAFTMEIIPPQFDAGMRVVKYLNRMYVIADQVTSGSLELRVNDFDQKADKWTQWRTFDLSHPRPAIYNCASFSKRFFHFRYTGTQPLRLSAVELDLMVGTV